MSASRKTELSTAYLDNDEDHVVEYEVESGQVVGYTACSPMKVGHPGQVNQDAVAVFSLGAGRSVLAVADGLGGHPGGDEASVQALRALERELQKASGPKADVHAAILAGFERANAEILALGTGAGTTLIVAEVDGHSVQTYHVGDSCAILTGGRGLVKLETVAHSPVGYALQAGLIDEEQAMVHEERHLVSNVVGDQNMRVEVGVPVPLRPRDTLLLASDGLFDNLRVTEIVEGLRRGSLGEATVAVVEECRRRMLSPSEALSKPDDLGLLVYRPR